MKISLILPHIYFLPEISQKSIFAPGKLFEALAKELTLKGHDITVFSSSEIEGVKCHIGNIDILRNKQKKFCMNALILQQKHPIIFKNAYVEFQKDLLKQVEVQSKLERPDIIHIFSIDNSILITASFGHIPVVYTNHDPYDFNIKLKKSFLLNKHKNYISISNSQRSKLPSLNYVSTVYNGINLNEFEFNNYPLDYFAYIGRIIYPKGAHRAIEAARRSSVKLKIAGQYYSGFGDDYFSKKVEPLLDRNITYEGFINNALDKSNFLRNAKGLLFPIDWDEPFGMVMIEALVCGTPVIAFDRGAVREIIKDGVNGFIVNTKSEMVEAIKNINTIDRNTCRESAMKFEIEKMTLGYIDSYKTLIAK